MTTGAATIYGSYAAKNASESPYTTIVGQTSRGRGHADDHVHATGRRHRHGQHLHVPRDPAERLQGIRPALLVQHAGNSEPALQRRQRRLPRRWRVRVHDQRERREPRRPGERLHLIDGHGLLGDRHASHEVLPSERHEVALLLPAPTHGHGLDTPILLQSVTATSVTLNWYNFLGGALAHTQTVTLTPGAGTRIDPWAISQLAADKQYSVVVDGGTGTVTAIVSEFAAGGDNAMMYEGFAATP